MATAQHRADPAAKRNEVPSGAGRRFALVVSRWNLEITDALRQGAMDTLRVHGVADHDVIVEWVPGSFELPLAAQFLLERGGLHGVICIGSVVRGATPHFDHVCQGVTQGVMQVGLKFSVPVIFCVLTDNTLEQARERSGGALGNKGVDCAEAVLHMAALQARAQG